jgi:hypothetical protein
VGGSDDEFGGSPAKFCRAERGKDGTVADNRIILIPTGAVGVRECTVKEKIVGMSVVV